MVASEPWKLHLVAEGRSRWRVGGSHPRVRHNSKAKQLTVVWGWEYRVCRAACVHPGFRSWLGLEYHAKQPGIHLKENGGVLEIPTVFIKTTSMLKSPFTLLREEGESHSHTVLLVSFISPFLQELRTWGHDLYLRWSEGNLSNGKKGTKACHCFYIHTDPHNQLQGKRRKYLGIFKQNGPFDLNVCFRVNNIWKLSIRDRSEESGLLKAARSEAAASVLSWRDWLLSKTGKWRSTALSFKTATTKNDNTWLGNLLTNGKPGREMNPKMTTLWEPLKTK